MSIETNLSTEQQHAQVARISQKLYERAANIKDPFITTQCKDGEHFDSLDLSYERNGKEMSTRILRAGLGIGTFFMSHTVNKQLRNNGADSRTVDVTVASDGIETRYTHTVLSGHGAWLHPQEVALLEPEQGLHFSALMLNQIRSVIAEKELLGPGGPQSSAEALFR